MIYRGITRGVGIANDLIQSQPGFLKRAEKLRFRAKLFLRSSHQTKNGAADHDKNGHRHHQLNQRKTCLSFLLLCELHFSTIVSRVRGKKGALPPMRRTPTMNRLPVGFAPLAYVMTAQRMS